MDLEIIKKMIKESQKTQPIRGDKRLEEIYEDTSKLQPYTIHCSAKLAKKIEEYYKKNGWKINVKYV